MERKDWMIAGEMILVGLIFVCAILIGTAWANTLYYGPEISYNASLTDANNSYVHQGDNITQGNYYDLSGIYGFSGILAHWNDDFDNAGVTEPDYMFTIISPYAVYIDPAKFPVGRMERRLSRMSRGLRPKCSGKRSGSLNTNSRN